MWMNYGFVWYVCVFVVKFGRNDLVVCFGEFFIDFVFMVGGVLFVDVLVFKKVLGGVFVNVVCGIVKFGGNFVFVGKVCYVFFDIFLKLFLLNLLVM